MTPTTGAIANSFAQRLRGAVAFFGVAAGLALLFHIGFVSMTGGSLVDALNADALFYFGLPCLVAPAGVALFLAAAPRAWQNLRNAALAAVGSALLHVGAVCVWIAGMTHALSRAYAIIYLAPAASGLLAALLALATARPFRR